MKDLRSLLRTVEVATAKTTKEKIQEGVLEVIRNNNSIKFDVALKLMTMSCNIMDHNTVVKLNKMVGEYYPAGDSIEEILKADAAPEVEVDNEAFEKMKNVLQKAFDLSNMVESKNEMQIPESMIAHAEDIEIPCKVITIEMDTMDEKLLKHLSQVIASISTSPDTPVVAFVKKVILESSIYKYCKIGESVVKYIIDNFCIRHAMDTDKVIDDNIDELLKVMNTFFCLYVLENIETKSEFQKSVIDKSIVYVKDAFDNNQYSELINYNNGWAICVADTTICVTQALFESENGILAQMAIDNFNEDRVIEKKMEASKLAEKETEDDKVEPAKEISLYGPFSCIE